MIPLPKEHWDNLRRRIEEILDLPPGSTNPDCKLLSPAEVAKKLIEEIENFLWGSGGK